MDIELRLKIKNVFDLVDRLIINGDATGLSIILDNLDLSEMEPELMVSYLSSTNLYKEDPEIKISRDNLYNRVLLILTNTFGEQRATNILKHLSGRK